jgi:hypothetical protein
MSSPTTRSFDTPGGPVAQQIADFVSSVRGQLNDLSADEVTELTGGLEADLADAVAEAGSTPSELYGDPAEYARELRAAAGLPPRGAGGGQRAVGPGFAEGLEQNIVLPIRGRYEDALRTLDARPWWPGVRDFLVVLRPAWWVLRAWVAVESLFMLLAVGDTAVRGGFGGLVLLLAVIVISVQVGRNTPLPDTWQRVTVAAWNVFAVLLLLPVMFLSSGVHTDETYTSDAPSGGLIIDGTPVTNVFPYDSQGRPLTGVQLYDQDGRPLETDEANRTVYDDNTGTEFHLVPGSPAGLAPRWNAFPLQQRRTDPDTGVEGPVEPAPQPLSGVPSTALPTITPSQTIAPSAGASPSRPSAPSSPSSSPRASKASKPKPTATR